MQVGLILRSYEPAGWGGVETAIPLLVEGLRHAGANLAAHCPHSTEAHWAHSEL